MTLSIKNIGLMDLAGGAIMERLNIEAQKIVENIADPNTDPKAARTLTVTFTFKADDTRELIGVSARPVAKLAPYKPVVANMFARVGADGGITVKEIGKGVHPDQVTIDDVASQAKNNDDKVVPMNGTRRV